MTTAYTEALPIIFFSVIVKRAAVARSYPGGPEAFDRAHQPAKSNEELSLLACMSLGDVDSILDRLSAQGLVPGQDAAVAEMNLGPLLECPGLAFDCEGDFPSHWTVKADAGLVGAPVAWDSDKRTAYTLGNPLGYSWTAPAPQECQPVAPASTPPRRVVFRSGPVHYIYDNDEEDEA